MLACMVGCVFYATECTGSVEFPLRMIGISVEDDGKRRRPMRYVQDQEVKRNSIFLKGV